MSKFDILYPGNSVYVYGIYILQKNIFQKVYFAV